MSEIRSNNRRDFVRLRVYGVGCEFTPNATVRPAAGPPGASTDPPASVEPVGAPATRDDPGSNARGGGTGRGYSDLIAQIYRSDRVVRLERRPAAPRRQTGTDPLPVGAAAGKAAVTGELLDVGGGGARFALREGDWPVRSRPSGKLTFEISGQRFDFVCELVRKTESRNAFEYVALWRRPRPSDIDRLMRAIFQIELSRRQVHGSPARGEQAPQPLHLAFDRRIAVWAAAGLAGGGAVFLLPGLYALLAWGTLTAALLIYGLLAR